MKLTISGGSTIRAEDIIKGISNPQDLFAMSFPTADDNIIRLEAIIKMLNNKIAVLEQKVLVLEKRIQK